MNIYNRIFSHLLNYLIWLPLILVMPETVPADEYVGALQYYYFARQPSARAEAMGRSSVASEAEAFSNLYNPALISEIKGLCLSASYSSPYYRLKEARFTYLGITYTSQNFGSFGLSRYNFDTQLSVPVTDENGNLIGESESSYSLYTLSYSYPLFHAFSLGLNLTYFYHRLDRSVLAVGEENNSAGKSTAFPIDIGLFKSFQFDEENNVSHRLAFGSSLYNITNAKVDYGEFSDVLPQVFHLGISYQLQVNKLPSLNLKQIKLMLQIEYQDVLNSEYYTGFKYGGELSLFDMLFLRLGYYTESQNDNGYPEYNKDKLSDFTYGFGISLPIKTLFDFPLIENFKFDMLDLQQPSYVNSSDQWDNYSIFNFTLNFNL